MFLTFKDPNGVQITWNFTGASFSTEQDFGAKEVQPGATRAKQAWPTRPDSLAAWGQPIPPCCSDAVNLRLDGLVLT
jgi:hypothetical protein